LNIGDVASATGLTTKAIRYYESIDLIPRASRSAGGYRQYDDNDLQTLRFIRRARDLGFSVEKVSELLSLYRDRNRPSSEVKKIVELRLKEIEAKVDELLSLRATLERLAHSCHGDERPDCPILEDLARPSETRRPLAAPAPRA
jgi:Cu(I)-responsive transcriptional regulator